MSAVEERERVSSSSSKDEGDQHQHVEALRLRLVTDLAIANELLSEIGKQITAALVHGKDDLAKELEKQQKIALEQRKTLERQLTRGEVTGPKKLSLVEYATADQERELENFLMRQTRKFRDVIPNGFIDLEEHLWANEDEIDFVYNRAWYSTTAPVLVANFRKEIRRTYVVAGNKGTGKSVFGFVLILHALKEGLIVAYQNALMRLWIVGVHTTDQFLDVDRSNIIRSFRRRGYEPAFEPGVYECEDVVLFERLAKDCGVMYIVDVGDSFLGEIKATIPKVVISSPNNDKLKRIGEVANPLFVYMPLWSYPELLALNARLPPPKSNLKYVKQDEKTLKDLYEIFGGVPRILFECKPSHTKLMELDEMVLLTDIVVWKHVFAVSNYARLPRTVPGMLVHIKENTNEPGKCVVEFASDHILSSVVRVYFKGCKNELVQFLNAQKPSRMVSAMRGALVEEYMHEAFGSQTKRVENLQIRALGVDAGFREFELPPMNHKSFRFTNMSDFTHIQALDYYQPLISNFPALDAIALLDRRLFQPEYPRPELVAVGFQATVSSKKRKGVPRHELHTIRNHLRAITNNPSLALFLVFVTVTEGIHARQSLGKPAEPADKEFVQFAIRGVSFESTVPVPTVNENDDGDEEEDV